MKTMFGLAYVEWGVTTVELWVWADELPFVFGVLPGATHSDEGFTAEACAEPTCCADLEVRTKQVTASVPRHIPQAYFI